MTDATAAPGMDEDTPIESTLPEEPSEDKATRILDDLNHAVQDVLMAMASTSSADAECKAAAASAAMAAATLQDALARLVKANAEIQSFSDQMDEEEDRNTSGRG